MSPAPRLLVLHAGAVGDFVLTLHAVDAVRRAWNAGCVTVAARCGLVLWAAERGLVDRAVRLDTVAGLGLYDRPLTDPMRLRRFLQDFDLVVSFLGSPEETVSRTLADCSSGPVLALDPRPDGRAVHITCQWLERLRHSADMPASPAIEVSMARPALLPGSFAAYRNASRRRLLDHLPAPHPIAVQTQASKPSPRLLLVHPGSGSRAKCAPLDSLERLVSTARRSGHLAAWIVGPDELERNGESLLARLRDTAPLLCEENLGDAAGLVCAADLYVGNDAGMTHLAALAGVHTLALFGPTDPRIWRPLGENVLVHPFAEMQGLEPTWTRWLQAPALDGRV